MRVAVVGAAGQLGAAVVHELGAGGHQVTAFARRDLDVTNAAAVERGLAGVRPDAIVNGAAWNDVDSAEDHPVDALRINAIAVRSLARSAEQLGAALVHYGTDFVFDGTATRPYTEEDRPGPRSVYAASKMLGEWFAQNHPRAYVLRVESLFGRAPNGPPPKGSVAAIQKGLLDGSSPRVFVDRTISPTFVIDAARATRHLLESSAPPGLYHCVNSGMCTWLELAQELARQLDVEAKLTPVRMADAPLRAQRPQFCALSNEKLRRAGFDMPAWQDALGRYVASLGRAPSRGT